MSEDSYEIDDSLKTSIFLESEDELSKCLINNLHRFKFENGKKIALITPENLFEASEILRDLKWQIELLLKLSDFTDYVSVLKLGMYLKNR